MPMEDVIATVMQWATATEALAALGAQVSLAQSGTEAPPEIDAALRAVTSAAGLTDLDDLAPPQRAMLIGIVRLYLRQSTDLLDEPARSPGWTYTDPVILDGWGRGSTMVPPLIAGAHADLADVESFLDIGTGVGLLAVAAANVWPKAHIVGVDPWEPSLERARAHVGEAGLADRITLRRQDVVELDDIDTYDCVWVPTFFLTEGVLEKALPSLFRSLRPGGWLALGQFRTPPDPLANAVTALRTVRGGGAELDEERGLGLLEQAGCESVHVFEPPPGAPLSLVLGQRPR
jgi:SAM-dependent methyltransferase